MTHNSTHPRPSVQSDRAVGAIMASAAGDALGAPHEFGPALGSQVTLAMAGGGSFGWAPGEWTDDTQTALAVLGPLAQGLSGTPLLEAVERGLLDWKRSGPRDVGNQTRAVLSAALAQHEDLTSVTAAWQAGHPDAAGNGSLMRTGPVALASLNRTDLATLASDISALTHAHDDAREACVLWTTAIRTAIDASSPPSDDMDWVDLVASGLDFVAEHHRSLWLERLEACRTTPPENFTPNGWVVSALQAALSSLVHTKIPQDQPCRHLRLAIEQAVRIGDDTDTVAAITGSLAGAAWGATAIPLEWRSALHGRVTYDVEPLNPGDLDRLARLANSGGTVDSIGWPAIDRLLPYYQKRFPSSPLAESLDDWITIGNVHALPNQLRHVDVVVSLCRMGQHDVAAPVEHHVVGLLDTDGQDNPNVKFVLQDTADFLVECARRNRRVFVHCVQAHNRTPAVASAYLVRDQHIAAEQAIARISTLTHTRPQAFLSAAVRSLE